MLNLWRGGWWWGEDIVVKLQLKLCGGFLAEQDAPVLKFSQKDTH